MRVDYLPAPDEERPVPAAAPAPPRPAPLTPAAILQLQRTAGNHAVARILARQEAVPEATAPDPAVIAFCKAVWPDDLSSQVRLVLEPTRLFPGVGLVGGGVADLIGAGQDLLSVPVGDVLRSEADPGKLVAGGIVGATIALRSAVNIANNAVGHFEMAPNIAVGLGLSKAIGEAATVVGAPVALATLAATGVPAAISEACGFIKIALSTALAGLDLAVALEAGAGVLLFDDDEEWWSLGCAFLANVGGDMLGMLNDAVGLWTLGGSQPGAVSQGLAATRGIAMTLARTFQVFSIPFGMIWNVRGGDAVKQVPRPDGRAPEPPEHDLRSPADAPPSSTLPLPRQAVDGAAATGPAWAAARMAELDAMRESMLRGDPIVRPVAEQMATLVEMAAAHAEETVATQEAIGELREGVGALLTDFEGRLELVAGVEAQATPALEQLDLATGQIAAAIAIVESFTLAGDVELGEGVVMDTIEGAVETGAGLLDDGLDAAKETLLVPLRELQEGLAALRSVVAAMIDSARIVLPYVQDAIAQLREVAAAADDAPAQLQAMIDACVAFSTAGEIGSFGEMMARWDQLGPEIDAATAEVAPRL